MDLTTIEYALARCTSCELFEAWFRDNERSLSNFLYGLTGKELDAMKFANFFDNVISKWTVFKGYHNGTITCESLELFLDLVAIGAEKLAEVGSPYLAQTLQADLKPSASSYRLLALNQFALVEDVRTDYISKFPVILEYLNDSLFLFDEGSERQVVDVLVYFFEKAKTALLSRSLFDTFATLKAKFFNDEIRKEYFFLSHQFLVDTINDVRTFDLNTVEVARERLEPSDDIRELFAEINRQYFHHPNVDSTNDNLWGYSRVFILEKVLERGKCDFDKAYDEISADDKVLLYCYFNMKKHFFTSYSVFLVALESFKSIFSNKNYHPVFIDLGCGPLTSGLALADLINTKTGNGINFSYIGIDIATSMLKRAETFENCPIFGTETTFNYFTHWNMIEATFLSKIAGKNNPVIFNASYLFASTSLVAKDLAEYVVSVAKIFFNVYFIFQNPDRSDRNIKYEEFKKLVPHVKLIGKVENITYKAASRPSSEEVLFEILNLKR